jgi:hypothetical protein
MSWPRTIPIQFKIYYVVQQVSNRYLHEMAAVALSKHQFEMMT